MNEATKTNLNAAIILPTYCEAENIEDIINTIEKLKLNSTLLVVDGSSPDGTQNIVRRLKENYKNIILLSLAPSVVVSVSPSFLMMMLFP